MAERDSEKLMVLIEKTSSYLSERGIDNARREAEWIFCDVLQLQRLDLYTRYDMPVAGEELQRLRQLVQRRGKREPLAYVLGNQPFRQLELQVDGRVLVPRPETELLIDHLVKDIDALQDRPVRVLDVGTGSGAIALAIKQERPDCEVHATDASAEAISLATHNGKTAELEVHWHVGHLATEQNGPWQLMVANLPYIADAERSVCDPELEFEPQMALYAEDHGLALIKELMADTARQLAAGGSLWLEHGWQQSEAIAEHAAALGLQCEAIKDQSDRNRFARLSLA